MDRPDLRPERESEPNLVAGQALQPTGQRGDGLRGIEDQRVHDVATGIGEQLPRDRRAARRGVEYRPDVVAQRIVWRQLLQHEMRMPDHRPSAGC